MAIAMKVRPLIPRAGVASLIGLLAAGCGSGMLTPRGADAGAGGIGTLDGGGAGSTPGDGPTAGDTAGDTPGGPGDPIIGSPDRWIYVATALGVERINTAGGAFQPFGVAAATRSVAVSPSGAMVAQELADQRIAVFDSDGAARATFDVRMGLLGWSDEATLLFLDPETGLLQQASVDGQTRRYLAVPSGTIASGYGTATLSPDRSLLFTLTGPFVRDNVWGHAVLVLSVVDGKLVRDLGFFKLGGVVWTGDGRLFVGAPSGQGFVVVSPWSGTTTPVPTSTALDSACAYASWYETGKILLGAPTSTGPGSDTPTCAPSAVLDVDSGDTFAPDVSFFGFESFSMTRFAQSADTRQAAVASGSALELGAVGGGARRQLGVASRAIIGVSWARPTGGIANLVAAPKPPETAAGLAGAPSIDSRSGGLDCSAGRWVNRTPNPVPSGWPAARMNFSFAFDSDRGTLKVEGGSAGNAGLLPILDYQTMEWNGALGRWTNFTHPDGFGPIGDRAMAYDARHKVVLALGALLPGDGTWTWAPEAGWKNLRLPADVLQRPRESHRTASVYDVARARWIVAGGGIDSATWEWDGAAWHNSAAPPPGGTTQLAGSRLVYDDKRARVYLLGNRNRGTAPWLYEPEQARWTPQPSSGPSPLPREWAGVAYDARRDRVMVFGGYVLNGLGSSGNIVGDMAEWDPASGAWQSCAATGAAPSARTHAALAYDAARDVLVLFGGQPADYSATADVWEWYVP